MDVRLSENFKVRADEHNYIIQKRSVIKSKKSENYGKEIWHNVSYHSRLIDVANKLVEIHLKGSHIENIDEINDVLTEADIQIDRILEKWRKNKRKVE